MASHRPVLEGGPQDRQWAALPRARRPSLTPRSPCRAAGRRRQAQVGFHQHQPLQREGHQAFPFALKSVLGRISAWALLLFNFSFL